MDFGKMATPNIHSTLQLVGRRLKNRLVALPVFTGYANPNGTVDINESPARTLNDVVTLLRPIVFRWAYPIGASRVRLFNYINKNDWIGNTRQFRPREVNPATGQEGHIVGFRGVQCRGQIPCQVLRGDVRFRVHAPRSRCGRQAATHRHHAGQLARRIERPPVAIPCRKRVVDHAAGRVVGLQERAAEQRVAVVAEDVLRLGLDADDLAPRAVGRRAVTEAPPLARGGARRALRDGRRRLHSEVRCRQARSVDCGETDSARPYAWRPHTGLRDESDAPRPLGSTPALRTPLLRSKRR